MLTLNFSWIVVGKLAGHTAPKSKADIAFLKNQGILSLVRLTEADGAGLNGHQLTEEGMRDLLIPVADFTAPTTEQIEKIIDFIEISNSAGRPVGISCGAGLGRTGTILACYLVHEGCEADSAINEIREKRPGSIETRAQENAVKEYALRHK